MAASLLVPMATAQTRAVQTLRIYALEGQNAVNYIPTGTATSPVVEVRDENDRPVDGAAIVFKLPVSGAGASFANGAKTESAISDFRGQAGVKNYTINNIAGRFAIEVTATYGNATARLLIPQTNSDSPELAQPAASQKKRWILLGIAAAAGAGVGVYFGTRSSSSPITISAGSVVFGGPR